jgi:hypothetical protein
MKVVLRLCALWLCGPLALGASAAALPAHGGSSAALDNMGQAVGGDPAGRDARIKSGRPVTQESTRVDSGKIGASGGRNAVVAVSPRHDPVTPPSAAAALARSHADRQHSLLSTRARGRIAPTSNRSPGRSSAAASGNVTARARGLAAARPQGLPTSPIATSFARILPLQPVATSAVRVPPSLKAAAAGRPNLGGPRATGPGRLGGPAIGRIANNTGIDGKLIHRKN